MKKIFILFLFATSLFGCEKEDNPQPINPVDQLPPPTQIGANTFGCLLDGQVFKPSNLSNSYNCFYQLVDGGYYFYVSGQKYISKDELVSIVLKTENKPIFQDQSYNLYENVSGNACGSYLFNNDFSNTSQTHSGELKITKLDMTKNIVSGTFWFDVQDANGIIHQIREGRFDMQFTQ